MSVKKVYEGSDSDLLEHVTGIHGHIHLPRDVKTVTEITGPEILDVNKQDKDFLELMPRVRELNYANYVGMDDRKTFKFRTDSGTDSPGPSYFQRVSYRDIDAAMWDVEIGDEEDVEAALELAFEDGDVEVWCDDKSMKWWGFGYILDRYDAFYSPGPAPDYKTIPPDIRNPALERMTCKHLQLVLEKIENGDYMDEMVEDVIKKQKGGKYERPSNIPPAFRDN